ncbi:MAG: hypothetical protein WA485_08995 [Candidatus Sulfotelmatobacter sp.]
MSTATSSNGLNASGSSPRIRIGRDSMSDDLRLGDKPVAANADKSPMGEAFQPTPIVVKQVDHNALQGSNQGDHRVPAAPVSMDEFKAPPSPRQQMRGQQDSRNYRENGAAFKSTSNSPDSDAGN